jgi:hypothetical protein
VKASEILLGAPTRLGDDLSLADDLLAVHSDGGPSIVAVTDRQARTPGRLGPVYRRVAGGDPVVPTGRVLVRFSGDADPAGVLTAAGYELTETLGYAPDAVWASAIEGGVVGSLSHLDRLTAAPGVVNAEPELISERAWR